jgi:chromosome condensin MukBEF MukE localization factor
MLSTLISLLLKKGVITERELEDETQEIGQAYKLMKYRNNLQKSDDLEEK